MMGILFIYSSTFFLVPVAAARHTAWCTMSTKRGNTPPDDGHIYLIVLSIIFQFNKYKQIKSQFDNFLAL